MLISCTWLLMVEVEEVVGYDNYDLGFQNECFGRAVVDPERFVEYRNLYE